MITDKGKSLIANYIATTFTKANVGSGGNNTSPSQLELDVPLLSTSKTAGASISDENVVDFSLTVLGTDASASEEVEFFIAVEVE